MSNLDVSPMTGALGAIVRGIDIASADTAVLDAVRRALDSHLVLYLPGQNLDRHALKRLGHYFGPSFLHPIEKRGFPDCPEVLELLRKPEDKKLFGGEGWHADVSWLDPSGYVSILHGIEIPPVGGDTGFASTQAAYDALSPGMQRLLDGMQAVHTYYWFERREDPQWTTTQPVVRTHPVTGRKGLYVNRMFTNRFVDMTSEESAPLLNYLFAHMERHEFTCRFRWQAGGLLIWDNRFTLHYPMNDFTGQRRRMIRTTSLEALAA